MPVVKPMQPYSSLAGCRTQPMGLPQSSSHAAPHRAGPADQEPLDHDDRLSVRVHGIDGIEQGHAGLEHLEQVRGEGQLRVVVAMVDGDSTFAPSCLTRQRIVAMSVERMGRWTATVSLLFRATRSRVSMLKTANWRNFVAGCVVARVVADGPPEPRACPVSLHHAVVTSPALRSTAAPACCSRLQQVAAAATTHARRASHLRRRH